ncbi:hypothetical protein IPL85_05335 [Candidatus Saccharibacteria bacterium]|nr:MAG: hypothetical protein IPL85_05335 [Candidatus Saccharibacteria bacterium]
MQSQVGKKNRYGTLFFLLFWLSLLWLAYIYQQQILDWWKLRGYTPSQEIALVADEAHMSFAGEHLFYVNKPKIVGGTSFATSCPIGGEKTIILGCYRGGDNGIVLYQVTDARLSGVIEVTAAHEMLHAAYDRLSSGERKRIDSLLSAVYDSSSSEGRVRNTVDAYRLTEPTELSNEMHSIFATEIKDLPEELETYYKQYFTNRKAVVALAEKYQSEFTARQEQIKALDTELAGLKSDVNANQIELRRQQSVLASTQRELDTLRRDDVPGYNARVDGYNQQVRTYNFLLEQTRSLIVRYNDTVEKRNAVALEERELTQALSADTLPAAR